VNLHLIPISLSARAHTRTYHDFIKHFLLCGGALEETTLSSSFQLIFAQRHTCVCFLFVPCLDTNQTLCRRQKQTRIVMLSTSSNELKVHPHSSKTMTKHFSNTCTRCLQRPWSLSSILCRDNERSYDI